jgi:hypothetical protein
MSVHLITVLRACWSGVASTLIDMRFSTAWRLRPPPPRRARNGVVSRKRAPGAGGGMASTKQDGVTIQNEMGGAAG